MTIGTVDVVASALLNVLNILSPLNNCVGTPWHSRWLSLTTNTAFTVNVALQPRAFIAMGVLSLKDTNRISYVTDDLMSEVLLRLRDALSTYVKDVGNDLPVSIILCLSRLFEQTNPSSKFFNELFWVAMTLIQIGDIKLFTASLSLLETILKTMDYHECFKDQELAIYLMARRDGAVDQLLSKLESSTGISFKQSFSFAVAAHLLKGLKQSATKTATARVLSTFVDIAAKRALGPSVLGYLAALLPVKGDEMSQLKQFLAPAGEGAVAELGPHQYLFTEQMLPDTQYAALLFTFLVTILQNSDLEHEQLFIYESLKEGITVMPEAFPVIYDILIPKMAGAIGNSQNKQIIDAVLSIVKTMFSYLMEASAGIGTKKLSKAYLKEIGFQGLTSTDLFNTSQSAKEPLIKTTVSLLDHMVSL